MAGQIDMNLSNRAIASRANGAKSRGPKSDAGRRRSSQNAIRHGLLAQCIVLKDECGDTFKQVLDYHVAKFKPADDVEFGIVEDMVAAQWRMRRTWSIETTLFDAALEKRTEPTGAGRIAAAFAELAGGNQLNLLDRYEARLQRMYQRSHKTLTQLRQFEDSEEDTELPNEPNSPSSDQPNEPNSPSGADAFVRAQSPDCAVEDPEIQPVPNEPNHEPGVAEVLLPNEPSSPNSEPETEPIPNEPTNESEVPEPSLPNEPNSANSEMPNEPDEDEEDEEDDEDEEYEDDDDTAPTVVIGGTVYKITLPPNIRLQR
jgi:hypothetical protein